MDSEAQERPVPRLALSELLLIIGIIYVVCTICYIVYVVTADAHPAILYSRCFEIPSVILMALSLIFMFCHYSKRRRRIENVCRSHATDIIYIILLGCTSFVGYYQVLATYIAVWNNNEALAYLYEYELIFDVVFIINLMFFTPFVAYYVLFFLSHHKLAKRTALLLLLTLTSGVFQKFGFEFVAYKTHYCNQMEHDGSRRAPKCSNWNDTGIYPHTIQELTPRSLFLHDLSGFFESVTYTATLDFFLSCGVVLICHLYGGPSAIDHGAPIIPNNPSELQLPSASIKTMSYVTMCLALLFKFFNFGCQPELLSLYSTPDWPVAYLIYNSLELLTHIICLLCFSFVVGFWVKSSGIAQHQLTSLRRAYLHYPDLFILLIGLSLTIIFVTARVICHMIALSISQTSSIDTWAVIVNIVGEVVMVFAFFAQFIVIKSFLFCHANHYRTTLSNIRFFLFLAPFAAAMNIWRFLTIFASKQGYLPFLSSSQPLLDNILLFLETAYPVPNIFSLTATICWCHVTERLAIAGAYPDVWKHHDQGGQQGVDVPTVAVDVSADGAVDGSVAIPANGSAAVAVDGSAAVAVESSAAVSVDGSAAVAVDGSVAVPVDDQSAELSRCDSTESLLPCDKITK